MLGVSPHTSSIAADNICLCSRHFIKEKTECTSKNTHHANKEIMLLVLTCFAVDKYIFFLLKIRLFYFLVFFARLFRTLVALKHLFFYYDFISNVLFNLC